MKTASFISYCVHVVMILCITGFCLCSFAYASEVTEQGIPKLQTKENNVNNNISKDLTTVIQINQKGREAIVSYRGGAGQSLLKSLEVQFTTVDNVTTTQSLGTRVGDEIVLSGTGCGDEIVVSANYYSGLREIVASETLSASASVCESFQKFPDPCVGVISSLKSSTVPVDSLPKEKNVAIQVANDIRSVVVSFRGGLGQDMVKSIELFGYSVNETTQTGKLDNTVGDSVRFTTDGCGIRVVAEVGYLDGTSYTVVDEAIATYVR